MAQHEYRQFQLSDDQLIVHTGVVRENFIRHNGAFAELNDIKFHPEYHTDIATTISLAKNTVSDAFNLKAQAKETADVKAVSKALEKSLRKLAFNVKSRFEDQKSIQKEFRLSAISDFTTNADTFIGYIKDVLGVVNKYQAELLEEGMKEELIATIENQLNDLNKQRREQIEAIQARPVLTKNRIDTMNALWKHLVDMRDASDIVFDEQPEIRALFALPKHNSRISSETDTEETDNEANVNEDIIVDIDENTEESESGK